MIPIKHKKSKKRRLVPAYEISEDDISFFLSSIKAVEGSFPKIRDLQKLLKPRLDLFKINTILRYLERSKKLETDLDGNIIWIREDSNSANQLSLAERADLSKEFLDFFSKKAIEENKGLDKEGEEED
ncbi:MAG: hypothetical protein M3297_08355 [Thermoproteota archaeon]|nr:hypothetical protein [Thermoproteota archaeon]